MNRKIASEFAIGVILLVVFVVAGISWLDSVKTSRQADQQSKREQQTLQKQPKIDNTQKDKSQVVTNCANGQSGADCKTIESACKPRYYEGEKEVQGWYVSESEGAIIMAIKKDETSKLPLTEAQISAEENSFSVKLVDPTEKIRVQLLKSSEEKPVTVTLQGYAEVCQQPPLVSLEKATIAFKSRS